MASSPTSNSPPTPHGFLEKVTLTGPQETLLATLYGRAKNASSPSPILNDTHAISTVARLDYDFSKTGMGADESASMSLRALNFDRMVADFIGKHAKATVLHLACGLDARCLRVEWGEGVRWVDVDLADVVELRRRVFTEVPNGDYTLLEGSATDLQAWIGSIPADRPTVVVFEGLTMYLREEEGRRLIEGIVERFRGVGGELVFDCFGTVAIWLQGFLKAVKNSGSVLYWALDDPKILETWCEGLRLAEDLSFWALPGLDKCSSSMRAKMWVVSWMPSSYTLGTLLRYQF